MVGTVLNPPPGACACARLPGSAGGGKCGSALFVCVGGWVGALITVCMCVCMCVWGGAVLWMLPSPTLAPRPVEMEAQLARAMWLRGAHLELPDEHMSAYVSIALVAYVSICQHTLRRMPVVCRKTSLF